MSFWGKLFRAKKSLHEAGKDGVKKANVADINQYGDIKLNSATTNSPIGEADLARAKRLNIHGAARVGDLETIKEILKYNPHLVSSTDDDLMTPLHQAAAWGKKEVAEFLLANNADVNAIGGALGTTPLYMALSWRSAEHAEVAKLLVKHGGHK